MANQYRGQVDLSIEGADETVNVYRLQYDGNALVELEEVMGMAINDLVQNHIKLMDGFKFRRAALFYGLQKDPRGKKLTLIQCGQMIASDQGKKIHEAILQGVFMALGFDYRKSLAEREALIAAGKDPDADEEQKPKDSDDPLDPED